MKNRNAVFTGFVLACLATAGLAVQWPLTPQEGVLVLRNGGTLKGHITAVGDHYIVTFGNQSEVKLATEQVEMFAASLEHAYMSKRQALPEGNVSAHLALAVWCLNQDMFARAADQALMAYAIEPDHAGLAAFERRLLFATRSKAPRPSAEERGNQGSSSLTPEQEIKTLPFGTVEQFTQKVQPVLLNRCATNACHGIRSDTGFQLLRPPKGTAMPNRYTQKNLQAALEFVNRSQPELSRLITAPNQAHGGLDAPIFDDREFEQRQQLVFWAQLVSRKAAVRNVAPTSFQSLTGPNYSRDDFFRAELPVPMTTYGIPKSADFPDAPRAEQAITNAHTEAAQAVPPNPTPANLDPLDPAIFNRRYARGDLTNPQPPQAD